MHRLDGDGRRPDLHLPVERSQFAVHPGFGAGPCSSAGQDDEASQGRRPLPKDRSATLGGEKGRNPFRPVSWTEETQEVTPCLDPGGMIVDVARRTYSARCRFVAGQPPGIIRWYATLPGAKFLPF